MKYLLKAIGLSILFIFFIIAWVCQFLWDFHYPPSITYKKVRDGWNEFVADMGDGDDYGY